MARKGLLDGKARKLLSEVSMKVTIPALLFTKVLHCDQCGDQPTCHQCKPLIEQIQQGWVLFMMPAIVVAVGTLYGFLASRLARCPKDFAKGAVAACALGNSTGLPIVLLSVISPTLKMSGNPSLAETDPLIFLPVYLMTYPIFQWLLGGTLLGVRQTEAHQPLLDEGDLFEERRFPKRGVHYEKFVHGARSLYVAMKVPPVLATIAGLLVGLTPVRGLLVDIDDQDGSAPGQWWFSGIQTIGQAAVPLNLIILGAGLSKGANLSALPLRVGAAIVFCKLLLLPATMIGVTWVLSRVLEAPGATHGCIWLVALVVSCTPTANTVVVMAEMGEQSTDALSTSIFVQYMVAPFSVSLWLTGFVWLLSSGLI